MPQITVKATEFLNKAQTKIRSLGTYLVSNFDHNGYQSDDSEKALQQIYEFRQFVGILVQPNYGGLSDKEVSDLIDFFVSWGEMVDIPVVNYTNYQSLFQENIIVPAGAYALQLDLLAETANRIAGDNALSTRVTTLENNQINPATIFPAHFWDNLLTTNAVVFSDDARLHTHGNKTQLDAITSQLITDLTNLAAHYASYNNAGALHVTAAERTFWNGKLDASALTALASVYAPIAHVDGGTNKHTIAQITGLQAVIDALNVDIGLMAGIDGRQIELQSPDGDLIQWRYSGDITWTDLGHFKGATGAQGNPFVIGARGAEVGRLASVYDSQTSEFTYLATDSGMLFWRIPAFAATVSGGWTSPIKFLGDNGWSPVLAIFDISPAKAVYELVDWIGGTGSKPVLDPGIGAPTPVRWFLGAAGFTLDSSLAINIRGPQGASGAGPVIGASGTLAGRTAHDGEPYGFIYLRTDVVPNTIYIKNSATSGDWSGQLPWQGPVGPTGSGIGGDITQTAHGLAVGNVVTYKAGAYAIYAGGDPTDLGVVSGVISANEFTFVQEGAISGLSGLTANTLYYRQTSGLLGTTPTDRPILLATSASTGYVLPGGGGGGGGWALSGSTTLTGNVDVTRNSGLNSYHLMFNTIEVRAGWVNGADESYFRAQAGSVQLMDLVSATYSTQFLMSGGEAAYTQTGSAAGGIQYAADYSAGYTTRSLVDKAYADTKWAIAGTTNIDGTAPVLINQTFGAAGALTLRRYYVTGDLATQKNEFTFAASGQLQLRSFWVGSGNTGWSGHLAVPGSYTTLATNITAGTEASYSAAFYAYAGIANGAVIEVTTNFTNYRRMTFSSAGMVVQDNTDNRGLIYATDYSAAYTTRSLVDKAYTDTKWSLASGGAITATNTISGGFFVSYTNWASGSYSLVVNPTFSTNAVSTAAVAIAPTITSSATGLTPPSMLVFANSLTAGATNAKMAAISFGHGIAFNAQTTPTAYGLYYSPSVSGTGTHYAAAFVSGAVVIGGATSLTASDVFNVQGGISEFAASTTTYASIRLPHGAVPTSPVNGDMWTTTTGIFAQINGATVGPFSSGGGSGWAVTGSTTLTGNATIDGAFNVTIGTDTGARTYGFGTGATTTGLTKTVNIGISGATGSTTAVNIATGLAGTAIGNVNIGSTNAAATLTINNNTIVNGNATMVLFNTASTNISFAGAATTMSMGGAGTITYGFTTMVGPASLTLFNTVSTTITAFGAATTALTLGNAGASTLTLNPGTVVGSQATQNLWNTVATTVSIAGAATSFTVGGTPTGAVTANYFTNATAAATKTINIGTGSGATSTTAINIGTGSTGSAVNVSIGTNIAGSTLTLGAPTVVGVAATQVLYNTVATNISFAGAATTISIGATTGTLTLANATINLTGAPATEATFSTATMLVRSAAGVLTKVVASGGGTTTFLRADGTWATPAGGGGGWAVTGSTTLTGNVTIDAAFDITIGTDTGARTYGFGTGATLTATTKTLNFGTAGVSGSTTNINLGSAVAGALGTITFFSDLTFTRATGVLSNSNVAGSLLLGTSGSLSTATPSTIDMGGSFANSIVASKAKWKLYNDGTAANTYGIGITGLQMNFFVSSGSEYVYYMDNGSGTAVESLRVSSSTGLTSAYTSTGQTGLTLRNLSNGAAAATAISMGNDGGVGRFIIQVNSSGNAGGVFGANQIFLNEPNGSGVQFTSGGNTYFTMKSGQAAKFYPTATIAGLNVGSITGNPSTLTDGDMWYNSGGGGGYTGRLTATTVQFLTMVISNQFRIPYGTSTSSFLTDSADFTYNGQTLALTASATGGASLNIPHGTAPTTPVNGDVWTTTTGFFARVNGSTYNFTTSGGTGDMILANAQTSTGKKTFSVSGGVAGHNIGANATDPTTTLAAGDMYYQTGVGVRIYSGTAWSTVGGGGGSSAGANTEVQLGNGSGGFVASGLFSSASGDFELGSTGIAGSRTMTILSSTGSPNFTIKNTSVSSFVVLFSAGTGVGTINHSLGTAGSGTSITAGMENSTFTLQSGLSFTTGVRSSHLILSSGGAFTGTANSGDVYLATGAPAGGPTGKYGNIGIHTIAGSFGGGEKVVFWNNVLTAPTTLPTGGFILYADTNNDSHPTIVTPGGELIDLALTLGLTNAQMLRRGVR